MYFDLALNLALLVALIAISGLVVQRSWGHTAWGSIAQGALFGAAAVFGMFHPIDLGGGLIFDGRSVVIGLCALFFGPLAAAIAIAPALAWRIHIGGTGLPMGLTVIVLSAAWGVAAFQRLRAERAAPTLGQLYLFGLVLHVAMVLAMFLLPAELRWTTMARLGPPVLLLHPVATALAGRILADQERSVRLLETLQATNKNLDVTLQSIGDAVISTDLDGRIVRMNPVAEQLTGWNASEAAGRRLDEVFRVEPENTGVPARDPYEAVMETGEILALGNHIELVARDGTRRPIADRAAPIRDEQGVISGVVLVFSDQSARQADRRQILESEARYRSIFSENGTVMLLIDPESMRIEDANAAAAAYYGWSIAHLRTMRINDINTLGADELGAEIARAKDRQSRFFSFRHRTASGEIRDVEVCTNPVRIGGRDLIISTVQDVTQRKRTSQALRDSVAEKEALLKELHHRVKNNLQVVSSLLRLEAARIEQPAIVDVLTIMQGRIRSMALLHETLYRSNNLARVDLAAYLERLAVQLVRTLGGSSSRIRLRTELTLVHLSIDQAIPCGLIVNELVSNCYKHAFPFGRSGEVCVMLETLSPDDHPPSPTARSLGRRLKLSVCDDGIGLPSGFSPERSASLGLQLVSDLARQLEGTLGISPGPGACFSIAFSAPAVDTPH